MLRFNLLGNGERHCCSHLGSDNVSGVGLSVVYVASSIVEEETVKAGGEEAYRVRFIRSLVGVGVPVSGKNGYSILVNVSLGRNCGELNAIRVNNGLLECAFLFGSLVGVGIVRTVVLRLGLGGLIVFVGLALALLGLLGSRSYARSKRKNHAKNECHSDKANQKLFHVFSP
jgi:hypothetical protein